MTEHHTSLTLREIEGATRWRIKFSGRSLPTNKEKKIVIASEARGEITKYRGRKTHSYEPFGLDWKPIEMIGRWSLLHMRTGDAVFDTFPNRSFETPQQVCDWMEDFLAREKVCELTWSGGFTRIVNFKHFQYSPHRSTDREWGATFEVLGKEQFSGMAMPEILTTPMALSMLQNAGRNLDEKLAQFPNFLDANFISDVLEKFSSARQALALLRRTVSTIGEITRAPAALLREAVNTAQSARDLMNEAMETFETTPLEYQSAYAAGNNTFSSFEKVNAYKWKEEVRGGANVSMDAILRIVELADALTLQPKKYVVVQPGANLARVAFKEYGIPDLWTVIASANGLSSQIVPAGVASLLIPEV